jgi:hypothetical protein
MADTHVFKLLSGVECEVKRMTGKHQRLLTENSGKNLERSLDLVLEDCIARLGSNIAINSDDISNMLSCDRQLALIEIRQFSLDFSPIFKFEWKYTSTKGGKKKQEVHQLEIDIKEGFPNKKPMVVGEDGSLVEMCVEDYSELDKTRFTILPQSGKNVSWSLLDGFAETRGSKVKKEHRSSHLTLQLRNPQELVQTQNGVTPIILDLDKLSFIDIEHLRAEMYDIDGKIDTNIRFDHPEEEKEITVDVLGVLAFFFPSGRI